MFNRAKPITLKMPVLQTPESFKGGTFKAGFTGSYAPIIIASVITILITSFNLATDWLAFSSIHQLHVESRFDTQHNEFYIALPRLLLSFCILSSIIYAMDVIHFIYRFLKFRKQFFDARDGVNNKEFILVRYGGEICVLLLVIFEDLPISLLILAVQGLISCNCLLMINHAVFYTCIVATCLSVVWKFLQVLWSSGMCGKREEYAKGRPVMIFRIITVLFLFTTLAVTILNSVLIKPDAFLKFIHRTSNSSTNHLFDKVYIEKWLEDEQIIFMQKRMLPPIYGELDSNSRESDSPHPPPDLRYLNIIYLSDVLTGHNQTIKVRTPCTDSNMNMMHFMEPADTTYMDQLPETRCSAVFYFHYDTNAQTLFYDYGYRIISGHNSHCQQGHFKSTYIINQNDHVDANNTNSVTPQSDPSSPAEIISLTPTPKDTTIEIAHHIMFMSSMGNDAVHHLRMQNPCDNVKLVYVSMRSFDACSDVLVDQ